MDTNNDKDIKSKETQNKLKKIQMDAYDEEKCKEFARKLVDYIKTK